MGFVVCGDVDGYAQVWVQNSQGEESIELEMEEEEKRENKMKKVFRLWWFCFCFWDFVDLVSKGGLIRIVLVLDLRVNYLLLRRNEKKEEMKRKKKKKEKKKKGQSSSLRQYYDEKLNLRRFGAGASSLLTDSLIEYCYVLPQRTRLTVIRIP